MCVVMCAPCRRVNYKLINRPARLGDPLIRGDVTKQENKGLFLSRCAFSSKPQMMLSCWAAWLFSLVQMHSAAVDVLGKMGPPGSFSQHHFLLEAVLQLCAQVVHVPLSASNACSMPAYPAPTVCPCCSCRDDHWRHLHRVWQPVFYADSVRACAPLMESTTQRMLHRLDQLAASGQPLDIWREVGNLTMGIVGTAAYG